MRIGTWNLDAKWSKSHVEVLVGLECDVWLLTEVPPDAKLPGFDIHLTSTVMARGQAWAGVAARGSFRPLPEPHPASAAIELGERVFCSSILPWSGCGSTEPWQGDTVGTKTESAVQALLSALPIGRTLWGGDWNHTLSGRHFGTSKVGRQAILAAIDTLELYCPTATMPHRIDGMASIDHVAVPRQVGVKVRRVAVAPRLSDHDAYVVEAQVD